METSFYTTVFSSGSFTYFPNNNAASFSNELSVPIRGPYLVGLSQISFPDTIPQSDVIVQHHTSPQSPHSTEETVDLQLDEPEETTTTTTVVEKNKFFTDKEADRLVKVSVYEETLKFTALKSTNDRPTHILLKALNEDAVKLSQPPLNITLEFNIAINRGVETVTILMVDKSKKYLLEIDPRLATIMGFPPGKSLEIGHGLHPAPNALFSDTAVEAIASLPLNTALPITLYERYEKDLKLYEPAEYYFDDLSDVIVDVFLEANLLLGVHSTDNGIGRFNIRTPRMQFSFSKRLNRLLELDDRYVFKGSQVEITIPRELIEHEEEKTHPVVEIGTFETTSVDPPVPEPVEPPEITLSPTPAEITETKPPEAESPEKSIEKETGPDKPPPEEPPPKQHHHHPILHQKGGHTLVLSSLIEPQRFGSQSLPVIRFVSPPEPSSHSNPTRRLRSITFDPVQYYMLKDTHHNQISVQLVDEHLAPIHCTESEYTTAVFHFRTIRI